MRVVRRHTTFLQLCVVNNDKIGDDDDNDEDNDDNDDDDDD